MKLGKPDGLAENKAELPPAPVPRKSSKTFHLVALAALAIACLLDHTFYTWANGWYNGPVPVTGELHQLVLSLAMYGQMLGIVSALVLVALFDRDHRGRLVILGTILVAVGLINSGLKTLIGRARPLESAGVTILNGPTHGLLGSRHQSFPSGHTATAFALSTTLGTLYPVCRPFVWTLAFGVGANRVITVRHFLTDVVAGAWLGYTLAAFLLRFAPLLRAAERVTNWFRRRDARMTDWTWFLFRQQCARVAGHPATVVCVALGLYWLGNGDTPLWDRDEPRFATATREMLARGDWILPTFNAELRPDKPILVYWFMELAYLLVGEGPFGARMFSGLAGAASVAVIYTFARSLFDPRTGLVAAWMLALSPMFFIESKLATADALLFFFVTSAMVCAWKLVQVGPDRRFQLLFWVCLGFAGLAKGPVAAAILFLTLGLYSAVQRDARVWRNLGAAWGLPLLLLIVMPWCVAVDWASGGEFLRASLGEHVLTRSVSPLQSHSGFTGYYLVSLLGLMAPWAWLLPWAIWSLRGRLARDPRLVFLACWAVATLILFELVRTKLIHYYLPAYPALLVFLAAALVHRFDGVDGAEPGYTRFPAIAGRSLRIGGSAALVLLPLVVGILFPLDLLLPLIVPMVLAALGLAWAGEKIELGKPVSAWKTAVALFTLALAVVSFSTLPQLGQRRLILQVGDCLREVGQSEPIALFHYRNPSLVHRLGRPVPMLDSLKIRPVFAELRHFARKNGHVICPVTVEQLELIDQDPTLTVDIHQAITGWDLQGMRHRTIYLVKVDVSPLAEHFERIEAELRDFLPSPGTIEFQLPPAGPTSVRSRALIANPSLERNTH